MVDRVYEFADGKVREHIGGIDDWIEKHSLAGQTAQMTESQHLKAQPTVNSVSQQDYHERKEQNRQFRRAEKAVADCEAKIERLEQEVADLEARLSTPEGVADATLFTRYASLKKELEDTMWQWETASEALSELQN